MPRRVQFVSGPTLSSFDPTELVVDRGTVLEPQTPMLPRGNSSSTVFQLLTEYPVLAATAPAPYFDQLQARSVQLQLNKSIEMASLFESEMRNTSALLAAAASNPFYKDYQEFVGRRTRGTRTRWPPRTSA